MKQARAIKIDPRDDLIVALRDLTPGETITLEDETFHLKEAIPAKHKFAARDFKPGEKTILYGIVVGEVTAPICQGELISTTNLSHAAEVKSGRVGSAIWTPPASYPGKPKTFMGYRRTDGRVGTANYWIILPLVFCSNRELSQLQEVLPHALGYKGPSPLQEQADQWAQKIKNGATIEELFTLQDLRSPAKSTPLFPNVDGVRFLSHNMGCGGTREDARSLCGLLAGYIAHPNVAGATVMSLGCQNAEISMLQEELSRRSPGQTPGKPVLYFDRQSWSGGQDMLSAVMAQTMAGVREANKFERSPCPISELTIGVECGGSDGFSGISANPLIGKTVDHLIASGGSGILSEFPELCGVENHITDRCVSQESAKYFLKLMNRYQQQASQVGAGFEMNPSPGNIRDGLITDAMKSAGAAKKGGSSPVVDVLDYPDPAIKKGLNLLCTPGNDVESTTALAASGANLILFSTGLGTPTGNPVVPVIKVATNSEMALRLPQMIDFDAGPILRGETTIDMLSRELLQLVIETASGNYTTRAELQGQEDFIPWKRGVSL